MKIRGTTNPRCSLCEYAFFDKEKNAYICKNSEEITDGNNSCKKFSYDIYKYTPKAKNLFGKFTEEDFKI